jgi:hypothetical protein
MESNYEDVKLLVYQGLKECPLVNLTPKKQELFPPYINHIDYDPNSKDVELSNDRQVVNIRVAMNLSAKVIKNNCINCPMVEIHKPTTEGRPVKNMPGFFNPSIIIQTEELDALFDDSFEV